MGPESKLSVGKSKMSQTQSMSFNKTRASSQTTLVYLQYIGDCTATRMKDVGTCVDDISCIHPQVHTRPPE